MVSPRGGYPMKRPAQESLGGKTLEYNWPLILLPLWFLCYLYSSLVWLGGREGEGRRREEEEERREERRGGEEGFIYPSKLD